MIGVWLALAFLVNGPNAVATHLYAGATTKEACEEALSKAVLEDKDAIVATLKKDPSLRFRALCIYVPSDSEKEAAVKL